MDPLCQKEIIVVCLEQYQEKKGELNEKSCFVLASHPISLDHEVIVLGEEREYALYTLAKRLAFKKVRFIAEKGDLAALAQLKHYKEEIELEISEVSDCGYELMANCLSNCISCEKGLDFEALKKRFFNKTAVICGLGPSLQEGVEFLKKIQDKALVLASHSAALYLQDKGIFPSIIGHIDAKNVDKIANGDEGLLIAPLRASRSVVRGFSGMKSFVCGAQGFAFEEGLYRDCFKKSIPLFPYSTVTDYLAQIALYLGCSFLFLVGVDLQIVGGCKYPEETKIGEEVFTPKDWIHSARRIEEMQAYATIIRINPSSFPLRVKSWTADTALKTHFAPLAKEDFKGVFQTLSHERIGKEKLLKSALSYQRCETLIATLLQACEEERLIAESELQLELYYEEVLEPLWRRWEKVLDPNGLETSLKKILFFARVMKSHDPLWKRSFLGYDSAQFPEDRSC